MLEECKGMLMIFMAHMNVIVHPNQSSNPRLNSHYCAMSKLVPQPQLLCAPGIPVTLNWLPINSIV